MPRILVVILGIIIACFCYSQNPYGIAATYSGVLEDPIALGAWLYKSKCVRCHLDYDQARLGGEYDDEKELIAAFGDGRCRISWSRRAGGTMGGRELSALARYMRQWEEDDAEPPLPHLPPLEPDEADAPTVAASKQSRPGSEAAAEEDPLSLPLRHLVMTNVVAHGGWLYTTNCYRCHLTYGQARMGKGTPAETVKRFISEGKTSTQMKPFSQMLGGNLKNKEIEAIVSYIMFWERAGEPLAIAAELMTPPALDPADFVPLRLPQFPKVSGDQVAGTELFRFHCSGCHGLHGEGGIGRSLNGRRWVIRPDLYIKSVVKSGIPGSLMRAWDIGKGGSLSPKEIDDVVHFVTDWGDA